MLKVTLVSYLALCAVASHACKSREKSRQVRQVVVEGDSDDVISYEDDILLDDLSHVSSQQSMQHKSKPVIGEQRGHVHPAASPLANVMGTDDDNMTSETTNISDEWRLVREDSKIVRVNTIMQQILSRLHLTAPPNITNKTLPNISHFMELKKQIDSQHSVSDADDATTHIVLNFPTSPPPTSRNYSVRGAVYFTLEPDVTTSNIVNATLWFFIRAPVTRQRQAGTTILINRLISPVRSSHIPRKQLLFNKRVSYASLSANKSNGSWFSVDIRRTVDDWVHRPESNHGLQVEAYDSTGNPLFITDLDDENRPFIELEIRRAGLQQSRDKRSTSLDCSEESPEHRCCRFPLEVDFEEMGWDWIIAPKLYRPYYCSGDCPFVFQPLSPHTHITYQHADRHRRLAAGPCCTPAKMSSISMLYFDERGNIIYATLPKMVADQCGCG